MGTDETLDDVAAALSIAAPGRFVADRTAAAASHPEIAKAVKALRKPVVAAWAVNLLVQSGGLTDALALGADLREAQDDLDAAELNRLGRQRRALVAGLATQAATLAKEQGVTVAAGTRDEIEKTINAAVMDASAAAAVSTGRLVRALEATGSDDVAAADAVNGSFAGVAPPPPPSRDDLAERRARRAAEQAVREAERTQSEADRALARIEALLTRARERAYHLRERIDDLRADLTRVQADADVADAETKRLEKEQRDAASAAKTASRDAESARAARDG